MIEEDVMKHAQAMLELSTKALADYARGDAAPPYKVRFLLGVQKTCFEFLDASSRARKANK